ncbi:MAG: glucokinase [Terriglobia bacterium]|jgi:glucokinase|nr:glucokinase [Terriglobia bacterium]
MILAGDIGGTHIRLAAFELEGNKLHCCVEKIYEAAEHKGLQEPLKKFIMGEGIPVDRACFGVAGPVRHNRVKVSNLDWTIDGGEVAEQLRLRAVGLLNDLEAYAYGIGALESKDFITLQEGAPEAVGNTAVISAETGLGEAGLFWDGFRMHPFACEGGHADFAPRSELEIELLKYLLKRYGHVSWERLLSGPGIRNIYEFLRDSQRAEEPKWLTEEIEHAHDVPALISQHALDHKAAICEQTMSLFVSLYGAEAGNCALKFMSLGGLYIGGSIAPKILPLMQQPVFLESFCAKGRMQKLLEDMPVKIVVNDDAGIIGAARYTLVQKAFGRKPAEDGAAPSRH